MREIQSKLRSLKKLQSVGGVRVSSKSQHKALSEQEKVCHFSCID